MFASAILAGGDQDVEHVPVYHDGRIVVPPNETVVATIVGRFFGVLFADVRLTEVCTLAHEAELVIDGVPALDPLEASDRGPVAVEQLLGVGGYHRHLAISIAIMTSTNQRMAAMPPPLTTARAAL